MSENECRDLIKDGLAAVAQHAAIARHDSVDLIAAAHTFASGQFSRDELIEHFARMIADGRYDAAKLGELGDDPELVKAVADLVKGRVGDATHQSSSAED